MQIDKNIQNYCIRTCKKEDKEKVISLYKEAFGEKEALRFERRWKWEFLDNPAKNKIFCNNWVIEFEGKIIGHLGALPALLKIKEHSFPCLWAVDLMIGAEHRGKNLAKKLYEKFEAMECFGNFMIGLSIPTAKIAAERQWKECSVDTVSLKIVNRKKIKHFLFSKEKFNISFSWIMLISGIIWGEILNCLKFNIYKKDPENINILSLLDFDERFDRFWEEISQQYPIIFLRNKDFLNWRFIKNPNYKYNILAAEKNNKISGFIVTLIEKVGDCVVGSIIDFLTPPQDVSSADSLIKEAVKYLESKGVDLIISTGLSKYQKKALQKNKFISNFLIQRHLRPRFFFKIRGDKIDKNFLTNPRNWFISNFNYDLFM